MKFNTKHTRLGKRGFALQKCFFELTLLKNEKSLKVIFHFGTESQKYPKILSLLTQYDDEHIKCLKYLTELVFFSINIGIFPLFKLSPMKVIFHQRWTPMVVFH